MNQKWKALLMALMLLATLAFVTGCSQGPTPYQVNDKEDYNVSIKFDANGGTFTTNTSVIVDSFNISEIAANAQGNVELALLSPDNALRGNDAFAPANKGYFLTGWYANRTDTGKVDEAGNPIYTYEGKWNFEEDTLALDPKATYSASEPVLTLYAVWAPLFQVEFYSLDSGEHLSTYEFNPLAEQEILVPQWDTETGAIEMYKFPKRSGYTFNGAYYDEAGTQPVDTAAVNHPGTVNVQTGTAENAAVKLYIDWMEGEWYHIYNVEQFLDNASVGGSYVIHADLDFTDKIWPSSFMYGNFGGTIQGNGHTFKNISFTQTNNSKINAGLFGNLTENAVVSDLTFENVAFTIKSGTRMVGTSFGLLAGTISEKAQLTGIQILSSQLLIDSGCYFGVDDYSVGLVCGMGDASVVADAQITCEATGDSPENVVITVNGNTVTLEFIS